MSLAICVVTAGSIPNVLLAHEGFTGELQQDATDRRERTCTGDYIGVMAAVIPDRSARGSGSIGRNPGRREFAAQALSPSLNRTKRAMAMFSPIFAIACCTS